MHRIELRLTDAESAELDELAAILNRRRADAARVSITGYLAKVRVTGGAPDPAARSGPARGEPAPRVPERVVDATFFSDEPEAPKSERLERARALLKETGTPRDPFE